MSDPISEPSSLSFPAQPEAERLEALMEAYQRGDRAAADALIERVSPALYRFFTAHVGDRRHADDLLQDAWFRIHKARHTYRPGERVLPWLYAIARHVKVDAFRKRRSELYEESLDAAPERVTSVAPAATGGGSKTLVPPLPTGAGGPLQDGPRPPASTVGSVKQKAPRAYTKLRALLTEGGSR
jgi:RNA polymerase sigma-70 factor (ECF subfamily)